MTTRYAIYIAALLAIVVSGSANAASFNCAKAATTTEKTICSDPELSKLDDVLSGAYREALGKGTDKASVKDWQKAWLYFTRDMCSDAACLKKAYTTHIDELREHAQVASAGSSISGIYQRFQQGAVSKHRAFINVYELRNNRVRVVGSATWVGNVTGNVNSGEINGVFALEQNKVHYVDPEGDGCRLNITLGKAVLTVTDDNSMCGGLNVSFNGNYRRITGAK
jgi:uncharacterized protein